MDTHETKELLHGAVRDVKHLVRLEARLIKQEAILFCSRSQRAAVYLAVAVAIAIAALTVLAIALASGLQTLSLYPQWLCFALVGMALIALSALCIAIAQRTVEKSIKELLNGSRSAPTRAGNREDYPVLARQD